MTDPATSNQKPDHVHHYAPRGSGLSCWAECDWDTPGQHPGSDAPAAMAIERCREKLAGDNGPIVGSLAKIERAIEEAKT